MIEPNFEGRLAYALDVAIRDIRKEAATSRLGGYTRPYSYHTYLKGYMNGVFYGGCVHIVFSKTDLYDDISIVFEGYQNEANFLLGDYLERRA